MQVPKGVSQAEVVDMNNGKAMFWGQPLEEEEEEEEEGVGADDDLDGEGKTEEGTTEEERKVEDTTQYEEEAGSSLQSFGIFDAQDNLKTVLAKVVKRVFEETDAVARKNDNEGLFDPYFHAQSTVEPSKRYYPSRVGKEHAGFFIKEQEAAVLADQLEQRRKNDRTLNCRVEDELSYTFDRKQTSGRKSRGSGSGSGSGSGVRGKAVMPKRWISNLSSREDDRVKADFAARVQERGRPYAKAARHKLDWVSKGRRKRDHRLKRLEHLLAFVQDEQQKDMRREMLLFECQAQSKRGSGDATAIAEALAVDEEARRKHQHVTWKVAQERTEVADKVMRLLHDYCLISGAEMALYLKSANDFFQAQLRVRGPATTDAAALPASGSSATSSATSTRRPATTIGGSRGDGLGGRAGTSQSARRGRNQGRRQNPSQGRSQGRSQSRGQNRTGGGFLGEEVGPRGSGRVLIAGEARANTAAPASGRPVLGRSPSTTTFAKPGVRCAAPTLPWSQDSARVALERRRRESKAAMAAVSELLRPVATPGTPTRHVADAATLLRAQTALPCVRRVRGGDPSALSRRSKSRKGRKGCKGRKDRNVKGGEQGTDPARRNRTLAPEQWGGWGTKLSAEAERILHSSKGRRDARPPKKSAHSHLTLGLRVDVMDTTVQQYSHLLRRGVSRPMSEQRQRT